MNAKPSHRSMTILLAAIAFAASAATAQQRGGAPAPQRTAAIPYDDLSIDLSGEEAAAAPQQARVRADLDGTPVETLPVYDYPDEEPI